LSGKTEKVQVHLKYKEFEQQFSAELQEAWLLTNNFFKDFIPSFDIAQKLVVNIDLQQLTKDLSGLVAFSNDGASLLVPKNKLTDNETLLLWLAAYYLGSMLSLVSSEDLSKDELQQKLGKSSKITSTRLGELSKIGFVQKTIDEKFRISTMGVVQIQREVIPKIKSKLKL